MYPVLISVAIAFVVVFVILVKYWWNEEGKKADTRQRIERGHQKEVEARIFLKKHGYKIVAEQTEYKHDLVVDGQLLSPPMRIDYMVEKNGKRYIVEVKSGEKATSMWHAPTRRQILEYVLVIPADGVFLLDMEREILSQVIFPKLHIIKKSTTCIYWLFVGVILGVLFTMVFLRII